MTHESLVHPQGAFQELQRHGWFVRITTHRKSGQFTKTLSNLTPLSGFEGQTSQKEFI